MWLLQQLAIVRGIWKWKRGVGPAKSGTRTMEGRRKIELILLRNCAHVIKVLGNHTFLLFLCKTMKQNQIEIECKI